MSSLLTGIPVKRDHEGTPIPNLNSNLRSSEENGKVSYVNFTPLLCGVYHYIINLFIKNADGYVCFGYKDMSGAVDKNTYVKLSISTAVVYKDDIEAEIISDIKAEIGVEYELIYDMNRKTMSIRCATGVTQQILKDLPMLTYLYVMKDKNSEYSCSKNWYVPPFMIQRYRITRTKEDNNNVVTLDTKEDDLYRNKKVVDNKIEYVVCNEVFKGKSMINEEMSDGIYHFYYEILSIGSEGISFGYCENADSSYEIYPYIKLLDGSSLKIENNRSTPIANISGVVEDIYEVIYDMINKRMYIRQKNGGKELISANLPTSIYPIIVTGNKFSVKLIEYYKEKDYYNLYENIELCDYDVYVEGNEVVINKTKENLIGVNRVRVPNTIYGIYNYKKYNMIEYLLYLIKNNKPYDIDNIKKYIYSIFLFEGKQLQYMDNCKSINELLVLLKYFHDDKDLLDSPDSFVNIINSLNLESDENVKCLDFTNAKENVFQFPLNKIYIRKCYYEMFRNIIKYLSVVTESNQKEISNVIVTGQPGIGKTSFIYVLLFALKIYLTKEDLTEEINALPNVIIQAFERMNELKSEIVKNYKQLELLFKNEEEKDDDELTPEERHNHYNSIKHAIDIISNESDYYNLKEDELINNNYVYNEDVLDNNTIIKMYSFSSKIEEKVCEMDKIRELVESNELLLLLYKRKTDELKFLKEDIELDITFDKIFDNILRKKDNNYKDIYVVKGKRSGTEDEKKMYILKEGVIFKIKIPLEDIKNSIVIVDTFNENFGSNNKIISISSPDHSNYDKYNTFIPHKELYFESLSLDEVKEWFEKCLDFGTCTDFKEICERYGNIPRQIYYHYLYRMNFKDRDYWDYYKQLMEGAIGSVGYKNFIEEYQKKENLKNHSLSNLILKYKLRKEMDNDLGCEIYKPEKELTYISNQVESYIKCKFYPPKNNKDYEIIKNYNLFSDRYMKRMALKQRIAYELSTNKIHISNPNFELDSKKEVSVYYPENALNLIYFILDDYNFFDLIMNGVFIKVLLDDKKLDDGKTEFEKNNFENEINKSIIEYSEYKSGEFPYFVIIGTTIPDDCDIAYIEGEEMEDEEEEEKGEEKKMTKEEEKEEEEDKIRREEEEIEKMKIEAKRRKEEDEDAEDYDVHVGEKGIYLMRKCFNDMLDIIKEDNFNFTYQRNYLIFGHGKIGKTVLGNILKDKLEEEVKGKIKVFLEYNSEQDKSKDPDFGKSKSYPYIVIVDGPAVGEDDYPDAKMIIMLANPCDKKCKTFQNKRCPLVMYIPPFTIKEIKQAIKLSYGSGVSEEIKKSYLENYKYRGGIIGLYFDNESEINKNIEKVNLELMEDIMRGITKSPLSKVDYQNIFIYETYEDDVTRSNGLRFISEIMRDLVYDKLFTIKSKDDCEAMINMYRNNPTGGIGGYLYEMIILNLINHSPLFQNEIVQRIKDSYDNKTKEFQNKINKSKGKDITKVEELKRDFEELRDFLDKKTIEIVDIKNDTDLENIIKAFNSFFKNNKITFSNLSYNHTFPDIDALIGPFGIQITVAQKHEYAPEMSMILHNLFKICREGYVKSCYKVIDKNINFGYIFVSPRNNVSYVQEKKRDTDFYPTFLKNLTRTNLKKNEKQRFYDEAKLKKLTITVTYQDLKNYCNSYI